MDNSATNKTSLAKQGTGTWTLSGASSFSGGTNLGGGTLILNNPSALGTGSLSISSPSSFDNASGAAFTLGSNPTQIWGADFTFIGSNNLNLGSGAVTLSANRTVTVNAGVLQVDGVVSGAFSLTKSGAGTLALNGNNTFTGGVALTGGTLILNKASGGGTGAITAGSGTTLAVAGGR